MSHTMTTDAPEAVTSYVGRHGYRFREEPNAFFGAFVSVRVQCEDSDVRYHWGKRIDLAEGIWTASNDEADRRMDARIESMFDALPMRHRDSFDRMPLVRAQEQDVKFVLHDNRFPQYGEFAIEA